MKADQIFEAMQEQAGNPRPISRQADNQSQ
jgi:hypothetical protein